MTIPARYNPLAASDLEFGGKSLTRRPAEVKHDRRLLCLRRACYSLMLLAATAIVLFTYFQAAPEILAPSSQTQLLTLPTSSHSWQRETPQNVESTPVMCIEDVVTLDSGEVLVLVRILPWFKLPARERIHCRFGNPPNRSAYSKSIALHRMETEQAGILCGAPPANLTWNMDSILVEVHDQNQVIHRAITVTPDYQHPLLWNANNMLVYKAVTTEHDVVVFMHGMRSSSREENFSVKQLKKYRCIFDGRVETQVTSQAQEIFRCAPPPEDLIPTLAGKKISLNVKGRLLPSLAAYNPASIQQTDRHDICACTLVYNSAKFLREWIHYHAHLGVEKFFLYDNNSEDNLDEVIASLTPTFNVTKQTWPWVKTQEAGFSHCALTANSSCKWMMFIDVDEYFFPHQRFLIQRPNSSILASFITAASAGRSSPPLGQIMTFCYNYGPSGLTISPPQGVIQGYTCRMRQLERHKSIVRLSAVDHSLANVIHHFGLKSGYETKKIFPPMAVINHYKFQAWDEFKVKFKRRAATYVADWTENRNRASKDRVPDLGTSAVKPVDWETRYCEVQDCALKNYTRSVFGSYDTESKLHFAWE